MNIVSGGNADAPKPNRGNKQQQNPVVVPKTVTDIQRLKLERLMQDPEKPVIIPDRKKEKKIHEAPEFVRNVMGSSAGAGSGEFHVYRHLRRKEYARQKQIDERAKKEEMDEDYHRKIEENKQKAEQKTAKKREKRLRKKNKAKKPKTQEVQTEKPDESSSDEEKSD